MGGGSPPPYNAFYVDATRIQAQSNLAVAKFEADADKYTAFQQSQAVVQQARLDYEARIYEADKQFTAQMEALRVREKEATLQYRVDWKNAMSEAERAESSKIRALADSREADAEFLETEAEIEDDRARREERAGGDGISYFYG